MSNYKVPFVDLPTHFQKLKKELMPVIDEVMFDRADMILRGDLKEFEERVARLIGTKHAIGLNSGTDALFLSLKANAIGRGDEVITVAHTFFGTVEAIVMVGAKPVLVDVRDDHLMNPDLLEKAVNSRTKAIIPVHLNGQICEMDKILRLAERKNVMIVEDACQAWGVAFEGRMGGSIGITGCFSLYPFKVLGGIGDGGVVTTNDQGIAEQLRLYRDHCQNRETRELVGYGYNSRLDNFNAAILNVKLRYLSQWIDRRREIARLYHDGLKDLKDVFLPLVPDADPRRFNVFQNYVIETAKRDELKAFLKEEGIETMVLWPIPIHQQKALSLEHFKLPVTDRISRQVLSLPMNSELTSEQVSYVIQRIRTFFDV